MIVGTTITVPSMFPFGPQRRSIPSLTTKTKRPIAPPRIAVGST